MISYELAKELKNAGFERASVPRDFKPFGNPLSDEEYINAIKLTELSELIEACGEDFSKLEYHPDISAGTPWLAWRRHALSKQIEGKQPLADGSTPEEAVANLWLALHEKKGNHLPDCSLGYEHAGKCDGRLPTPDEKNSTHQED